MEIAVTVIVVVLLTAVMLLVSRAGGRKHQEALNDHGPASGDARQEEEGMPDQPKADRPAGPGAEPMGVADAGDPSVDPSAEHRS